MGKIGNKTGFETRNAKLRMGEPVLWLTDC